MDLGKNIGRLRRERNLTFEEIAIGADIPDAQTVFQLVSRDSRKSKYATKLAKFFNMDVAVLLGDDQAATPLMPRAAPRIPDGDKLLVVLQTFLDTDAEGREELLHAAIDIAKESGDATIRQRRTKRR